MSSSRGVSRESAVAATSAVGVAANALMASVKVFVGIRAASMAIVSEGVNNFTDALSSVLSFVGTKLAYKYPDKKHPFGYGRIEYLVSLVISILILFSGAELLIGSVKLILHPVALGISYVSMAIVFVSAILKFALGVWTMRRGKKFNSSMLEGVGADSKNDAFISIVTLFSAGVFLAFGLSIDGYAGIIISLFVVKSGIEILAETVSELLGRPGKGELASQLYTEILATEGVLNAADMMLHNYGPDSYSGSVNIEIDHGKTVGEVYAAIHKLQLRIMHEHKVTMVFGIYAVANDHDSVREMRRAIADFVRSHEHVRSYHALYFDPDTDDIYCDLVVDYELKDWDSLSDEFRAYIAERYPGRRLELTIETEFV